MEATEAANAFCKDVKIQVPCQIITSPTLTLEPGVKLSTILKHPQTVVELATFQVFNQKAVQT